MKLGHLVNVSLFSNSVENYTLAFDVSVGHVTIGKYLTPKLYISLGRSLFTEATLVTLRYTLSKRLEIETTTGTESGATLFYRIEFR